LILIFYSNTNFYGYCAALAISIIAIITDFIDGKIARNLRVESETGYILDGLGDRALHLSFILCFFKLNYIGIYYVWLLIFREICIYALRIIIPNWLTANKRLRWISLYHAGTLRLWIIIFFIFDFFELKKIEFPVANIFIFQDILIGVSIILTYYGMIVAINNKLSQRH